MLRNEGVRRAFVKGVSSSSVERAVKEAPCISPEARLIRHAAGGAGWAQGGLGEGLCLVQTPPFYPRQRISGYFRKQAGGRCSAEGVRESYHCAWVEPPLRLLRVVAVTPRCISSSQLDSFFDIRT